MGDAGVGWIAAIVVGGIAGWLAEQFMKSNMGLIMNIVLGIVGAAIASAILSALGISLGGWVGYLISGFIGAALLIWIVRAVRPAGGHQKLDQQAAHQPSGNGTTGQAIPLSLAALGSRAFGDGKWGTARSAVIATRTSLEWTCQNLARAFELCPVVISCIGTPFWVACLQSDPLSKKNCRDSVYDRQTLGRTPPCAKPSTSR